MNEALWAFGRASGAVSLGLFTLSVVLGILVRSGRPLLVLPRFSLVLVHRNIALLAVVFLGLHVGSLLLDPLAQLRAADVVVPFMGSFKPFWQGLGTLALDLAAAIAVTSLLRRRLGPRVFRTVHWATYALWPVAMAHAIGNGTDGTSTWFLGLALAASGAVAAAVLWRLSAGFIETARHRQESRV
ncbi:MAG TPA: ferric reductase-like transmembrane domain-containing protein [Arthrobacter sp.]|nr:ferric reductase-like transmembrane domain-containing protein [Arthrobacter sp.]